MIARYKIMRFLLVSKSSDWLSNGVVNDSDDTYQLADLATSDCIEATVEVI